jgi:hypothetical protein
VVQRCRFVYVVRQIAEFAADERVDNWPLAGYVIKAFLELLKSLSTLAGSLTEELSDSKFEPPRLPDFESAKCTGAE